MNKNTTPRERAAEQALLTLREMRTVWASYKAARQTLRDNRHGEVDWAAQHEAVCTAIACEARMAELLTFPAPTDDPNTADIPGRPGWPIETETEK
jgi:hypothetical protein